MSACRGRPVAGGGPVGDALGEGDALGDDDGEDGDGSLGEPAHGIPLRVHEVGLPGPVPRKPNDTDAPGATVPFHERFVNV